MRRAPLVIAGTVAGTAVVLAFPVESAHSNLVGASATSPGSGSSSSTTAPASSPPSTSGASAPSSTTAGNTATATASATGADTTYPYGQLAVAVTVADGRISKVTLASISERDPRSAEIDQQAIPLLEQQVITADSASITGISGATYTSDAFIQSLTTALAKLGFK